MCVSRGVHLSARSRGPVCSRSAVKLCARGVCSQPQTSLSGVACVAAIAVAVSKGLSSGVSSPVRAEGMPVGPVLFGGALCGLLAFAWPRPMWEPVSPGGWTSEPGCVCLVPLCGLCLSLDLITQEPTFRLGLWTAGGRGGVRTLVPPLNGDRKAPNNTKEMKSLKWEVWGLTTTCPGKPQTKPAGPSPHPRLPGRQQFPSPQSWRCRLSVEQRGQWVQPAWGAHVAITNMGPGAIAAGQAGHFLPLVCTVHVCIVPDKPQRAKGLSRDCVAPERGNRKF